MKKELFALFVAACMVVSGVALCFLANNSNEQIGYGYKGQITSYLHEIEFDDYIDDPSMAYVEDHIKERGAGCSSVRNGDFAGRNFDYFYNEVPSFVIKTNAVEGKRFASIGVAQHWGITEKDLNAGRCWGDLRYLPNLTLDGVNENGVYINDNVVMIDEEHPVTDGTNPDAEKSMHFLYVPRYVLDHAETAEHAVELLKNVNICGSLKDKYYLHFMIADADSTYIVEAFDNQLVVSKNLGTDSNECTMTNHYVNTGEVSVGAPVTITDGSFPLGMERRWILQKEYGMGSTFDGMFYLMQEVKYSNMVLLMPEMSADKEFFTPWFSDAELFTYGELKQIYESGERHDELLEEWETFMPVYQEYLRDILNRDDRSVGKDWITIHNSTYDIANKKLQVVVDEDYLHAYTFSLR